MHDFEEYGIYGVDHRHHGDQKTICPKCSRERKKSGEPCLSVNVGEGVWNCWHCGRSGSLKTGWSDERQQNWPPKPNAWQKQVYRPKPIPVEVGQPTDKVLEWFAGRGISREIVRRNGIGFAMHWMQQVKAERRCTTFPYRVNGETVNVKYRTADKLFAQEKGGDKVFYKIDDLRGSEDALICEGEIDALSFEAAGFIWAVSVPDGAINENVKNLRSKLEYLDNCGDWLEDKRRVYLATDTDAPGLRLRDELARRLGKERCWIVRYPEDCKDANDVLMKHGTERLRQCVESAEPYPIAGLSGLSDFEDELDNLYEYGYPEGAAIGIPIFDDLFKFFPGQLTVVTGIPSHGKSTWCDYMKVHLAKNWGWRWGMFTPENFPPTVHLQRLCEMYIGKGMLPTSRLRMSQEEYEAAKKFVNENFFYAKPENGNYAMDAILELATALVKRRGIAGFEIDPFNKMKKDRGQKETDLDYIQRILVSYQTFAQIHGVHCILVAHPRKMERSKEKNVYGQDVEINFKPPDLYSISGSGDFYNMTDNGIVVYRYTDPKTLKQYTVISIQKVKFEYIGKLGRASFRYDLDTRRFTPDTFDNVPGQGGEEPLDIGDDDLPVF